MISECPQAMKEIELCKPTMPYMLYGEKINEEESTSTEFIIINFLG